ncbi:MAG: hypothetical protein WA896_02465 [Spirulinaceae cyanobacterium]
MVGTIQGESNQNLKSVVNRILETGCLTHQEHFQLMTHFLANSSSEQEDRSSLNRVFDELQMGRLQFVD